MFNNQDFRGIPNWLMFVATSCAYNVVFEYSRFLGITWVNIPLAKVSMFKSPPATPDAGMIWLVVIFLLPALLMAFSKCMQRIHTGKVSKQQAFYAYTRTLAEYLLLFLLFLIFVPLVGRLLRGW